jgi:hypothetical protein
MLRVIAALFCLCLAATLAARQPAGPEPPPQPKYRLRYRFQAGETIRWQVEHTASVKTTAQGSTQTAETISRSVKVWKVTHVADDGTATFEHLVDEVDMLQKVSGRQEVHYNSRSGEPPPPGFEEVAASVGVTLTLFTLDNRGSVVRREDRRQTRQPAQGMITIPLPEQEVAVGEHWDIPHEVSVTNSAGLTKRIKTRQRFTLAEVTGELATIRIETHILSPIDDPQVEAQLVQLALNGEAYFDLQLGRVVRQQTEMDRTVHGAQGEGSVMHYATRFTERLASSPAETARRQP